ncbi:MAG: MBL fold metallo-hydrolase [Clostridia bacterium]|nr:MBL fold metallo-hydrolase [Clostridia bacterium]
MSVTISVTYLFHSGFMVSCADNLMVFDYWRGENGELDRSLCLSANDLQGFKQVLFFISHAHPDHYDQAVYDFKNMESVHYIIASDMPAEAQGDRLAPGDTRRYGDVTVTAYDSTDLGVSFYVEVEGRHIFHAGDLNLWHWRETSKLREITLAENQFYDAVKPLIGKPIDVCMFPVDSRMGAMFEAGANYFIMSCKPSVFIPMHSYGRTKAIEEYAKMCKTKYTSPALLTKPRERVDITFDRHSFKTQFYLDSGKEDILRRRLHSEENGNGQSVFRTLDDSDPFAESDLPVDVLKKQGADRE